MTDQILIQIARLGASFVVIFAIAIGVLLLWHFLTQRRNRRRASAERSTGTPPSVSGLPSVTAPSAVGAAERDGLG
jgi:hypothetical protein